VVESGGLCAFAECRQPLLAPSRGWIGTVAHIVAAERSGPRGESPLTAEERALGDNLILLCSNHAREIDTPQGVHRYPEDRLSAIKQEHRGWVSAALDAAAADTVAGLTRATVVDDFLDVPAAPVRHDGASRRSAQHIGVLPDNEQLLPDLQHQLRTACATVEAASPAARGLLGLMLDLPRSASTSSRRGRPVAPALVVLRVRNQGPDPDVNGAMFVHACAELVARGLLEVPAEPDDEYLLLAAWSDGDLTTWDELSEYFEEQQVQAGGWVRSPDPAVFD
jgi:hypothetical protein